MQLIFNFFSKTFAREIFKTPLPATASKLKNLTDY